MFSVLLFLQLAHADAPKPEASPEVLGKIENTRAGISDDERKQREALSHLFLINKKVKDTAQKQANLNQKLMHQEALVRTLAQDVDVLETRKDEQKDLLNKRLRQLYQEHDQGGFHWLFSAQTPVELDRGHRFLKRMVDADHRRLKTYLENLAELKSKRNELKSMIVRLASMQKIAAAQEKELAEEMRQKSQLLAELKKSKDLKLTELKGLREKNSVTGDLAGYAFFERKGAMHAPVSLPYTREYGTIVDPQFRFRLMHKGLFYTTGKAEVRAIFSGRVAFAGVLPGYGRAIILDHGDNYYSVYGLASKLKVREGSKVQEGDVIAVAGEESPLFGPGLYFEIRHFTDAIDPRPWIKESLIKTADSRDGESL